MKLLVSGCSFTSDPDGWQSHLESIYSSITNLAHPAVGNTYIANTLQDKCQAETYDMVLVMWSGYSRIDIPSQWRNRRHNNYEWFVPQQHSHSSVDWMLSGGHNAGWRASQDHDVRELFQRLYLEMDFEHLAYLTLKNILNTQYFLKSVDIPYRFMSFINFWDDVRPTQKFSSFYYDDPPIARWQCLRPLIDRIDWNQWIFDDGRNGIYERCLDTSDLADDNLHPGIDVQHSWGNHVLRHLQGTI